MRRDFRNCRARRRNTDIHFTEVWEKRELNHLLPAHEGLGIKREGHSMGRALPAICVPSQLERLQFKCIRRGKPATRDGPRPSLPCRCDESGRAPKGRSNLAQGNALGLRRVARQSPERAIHESAAPPYRWQDESEIGKEFAGGVGAPLQGLAEGLILDTQAVGLG